MVLFTPFFMPFAPIEFVQLEQGNLFTGEMNCPIVQLSSNYKLGYSLNFKKYNHVTSNKNAC